RVADDRVPVRHLCLNEKGPVARAPSPACASAGSERLDVRCLDTFRPRGDVEGNLLVFLQALEARTLDCGEVREHVLAAAIRGDEAKTFRIVKPLDGSGCHV